MNSKNEISELLGQAIRYLQKRSEHELADAVAALATLQAEPVGKLVDAGFKQIEWYNKPPIDSLLYTAAPQPAKVPEALLSEIDKAIDLGAQLRGGTISGVRYTQKLVRDLLTTATAAGEGESRCLHNMDAAACPRCKPEPTEDKP